MRFAVAVVVLSSMAVVSFAAEPILAAGLQSTVRPSVAATAAPAGSGPDVDYTLAGLQLQARAEHLQVERQAATPQCDKVIDVDLTAQQLVASACGRVMASTPITSGRPALRTPTGTYSIFLKEQGVYFNSPWPLGDPNYYPPMLVAYAMEFMNGGFFLHTDPDEPLAAFGPGSQDGPYASHGCVHVPAEVMAGLFAWADAGTVVRIHY